MTDKKRAALQAALDAITELEGYSRSAVTDKIARDAKQQLRAALAEQPVKESLTTHPSIIDSIADHLIDDHVALMNENKRMRAAAQAALEAMEDHANQYPHMQKGYTVDAITDLRAALAEPDQLRDATEMIGAGDAIEGPK